jgi:hypothetical protein
MCRNLSLLGAALLMACGGNNTSKTGVGEPLVIKVAPVPPARDKILAQFIEGDLPGSPPSDAGLGSSDGGVTSGGSVGFNFSAGYVYEGQGNLTITGTAPLDAASVALRLSDVGSGYWVVPMGPLDTQTGLLSWSAMADFSSSILPGWHPLKYVAIDNNGVAGQQQTYDKLCVANRVPDNFNSCIPTAAPPANVISLSWDANVDLDLQVTTPDGTLVEPQNPKTPDGMGTIDRDSNANCVIDGIRYENLVWKANQGPHGRYGIYVNLVSACGKPIVHFNVGVYSAVSAGTDANGKALQRLYQDYTTSGELLDFQANGGSGIGLFVTEFIFN